MFTSRFRSLRPQLAATALALTIGLSGAVATAQDASPEATAACEIDTAAEAASPEASPAAETPEGTPVEDEAIISAATDAVLACNPDIADSIEVDEVIELGDGTYGVEYQFTQVQQVLRVLEMYAVDGDTWALVGHESLEPDTDLDTTTLAVNIGGDVPLEVAPGAFSYTDALRLQVTSSADTDVTIALYASGEEPDTESLAGLDAESLPEDLTFAGEQVITAGADQKVLFEGLDEGTHVIVLVGEDGTVTAASPFTIDPPIEIPD